MQSRELASFWDTNSCRLCDLILQRVAGCLGASASPISGEKVGYLVKKSRICDSCLEPTGSSDTRDQEPIAACVLPAKPKTKRISVLGTESVLREKDFVSSHPKVYKTAVTTYITPLITSEKVLEIFIDILRSLVLKVR